jgi:CheY-like chemotaxis protein
VTKRILVIDDEEDVRQMIDAILSTKGHEILTAAGGEEGLRIMETEPLDLVVCDLMMPRISGLEVIKRKKRNPKIADIPMMILSALADDRPTEFWTQSLGIDDYLIKPFDPLDLLGRVEFLFRRTHYVSTRPGGYTEQGTDATLSPIDLVEAVPSDVVRAFVESWNTQDFATEFDALGDEMLGGLGRHDYVERRRHCFIDEKGMDRLQRLERVVEEKVSINVAKVVIDRNDRVSGREERRKETYTLKKTHRGWKIIACRRG